MPKWHVIGLFEGKHIVKDPTFGYVCVWARIRGPFPSKAWADAANEQVGSDTVIHYRQAQWHCVYSLVVGEYDLREYGLRNNTQVNGQLVLPDLSEVL